MTKHNRSDIDIVITWVDGNDPNWLRERARWAQSNGVTTRGEVDARDVRYCPWDTLRYLFRGIDEFAPWVRRVHLVTWGHLPSWLDTSNNRLSIVKHEDFIPSKYLPTFSSHAIEFNLHRIPGLSDRFVYFNDDMLIIKQTDSNLFFRRGLPCDTAVLSPNKVEYDDWFYAPVTNMAILNKHFRPHKSFTRHPFQWLNVKYGVDALRTISMLPYPNFFGILNYHVPYSFLRSSFEEVWEAEPEIFDSVCSHKFRVTTDPNPWLIQGWQIASGRFCPRSSRVGKAFHIRTVEDATNAAEFVLNRKMPLVCINDAADGYEVRNECRHLVEEALRVVLPRRSSFEVVE